MRHFIGTAWLALCLTSTTALAESKPMVVLELFTSQGCSACPPADSLLHQMAEDNSDILALSFHVDYWDYIGWTDTFGDAANVDRQKTYARRFHERMIYTPQIVVQGLAGEVGHKAKKIEALVEKVRGAGAKAKIDLIRQGDMLTIAVAPTGAGVGESELHLVRFMPSATVKIGRGENSGRELSYTNVVRSWQVIDLWNGEAPATLTVPLTGDLPAAVLVQGRHQGDVFAAAAVR